MDTDDKLIVALDLTKYEYAKEVTRQLSEIEGLWGVKVNSLLRRFGYPLVAQLKNLGVRVMADLKLHDIPNTVAQDCAFLKEYEPDILTVHASGGEAMIKAAVDACGHACAVFCITVLTSLDDKDAQQIFGAPVKETVCNLAKLAAKAGADGMVCSPHELGLLNQLRRSGDLPPTFQLLTPGIRPAWGSKPSDQKRFTSPKDAIQGGADLIVVGRPILDHENPVEGAQQIVREILHGLVSSSR